MSALRRRVHRVATHQPPKFTRHFFFLFPPLSSFGQLLLRNRSNQSIDQNEGATFFPTHTHLVRDDTNLHAGLRVQHRLVREGLVSNLVEGIAGVGDKLTEEDLFQNEDRQERGRRAGEILHSWDGYFFGAARPTLGYLSTNKPSAAQYPAKGKHSNPQAQANACVSSVRDGIKGNGDNRWGIRAAAAGFVLERPRKTISRFLSFSTPLSPIRPTAFYLLPKSSIPEAD